jgi:hypothetical protein
VCSWLGGNRGARRAWKNHPEFGEFTRLSLDLYRSGMLFDNNVVAKGQTETCSLSRRLCRKKRIEHLFPYLRQDASAVIAYLDFHTVAQIPCLGRKQRFVAVNTGFALAFHRRIESV